MLFKTLGSYLERALFYANQLAQYERESEGRLTFIKTRQDLEGFVKRRATDKSITSALFSVEGLQCLDGQLESVDRLVEAGMRMAGTSYALHSDMSCKPRLPFLLSSDTLDKVSLISLTIWLEARPTELKDMDSLPSVEMLFVSC